ncbi:MAG: DUF2169 domain-containing protein [Sandaracinaceae bacterium]|nr:DUF2169 domain-containing protein [Sandaracinaceae bacterium]
MELIRDTPFEVGFLCWPVRPPRASLLVVVKATYELRPDRAVLAPTQSPPTGELYWDDDPARSVRYPTDYALNKPRGECFVVGHVRTLTERPEARTAASFRVGPIGKTFAVHGDRAWGGGAPTRPVPFTEMPLAWERAFGGPGFAANPMGRGIAPDAEGVTWLPNLELEGALVVSPNDRPTPAASGPIGYAWPARQALTGTYDAAWRQRRFPWLPDDFRFAWFNEAPADQQIEGYWPGGEDIELHHLHPRLPRLKTRLPKLRARAFVERAPVGEHAATFEEVVLSPDTIVVDADAGVAHVVWRGLVELGHDRRAPDGIDRLFVIHEAMDAAGAQAATVEACRARMHAKLEADAAAREAMRGAPPPPVDAPIGPPDATLQEMPSPEAMAQAARELEIAKAQQRAAEAPDPLEGLHKLEAELKAAGIDIRALSAEHEREAESLTTGTIELGPSLERLEKAFQDMGAELPADFKARFEEMTAKVAAAAEEAPPPPPAPEIPAATRLRKEVLARYGKSLPLQGDLSGANLSGLDLHGVVATGAILKGADFRGTNLSGAQLDSAVLTGADLLSANLSKASLAKADLTGAVLEAADLRHAQLVRATLARAELGEARLDGADLSHADLTGADLRGASLIEAVLDEALLNGAKLAGAKVLRTSLRQTRLYGIEAIEVVFERASLDGARFGRGASLARAVIRSCEASDSKWREIDLSGVRFEKTRLDGADFTGAKMVGASLAGCYARHAILTGAQLSDAQLSEADLYEASFMQASLHRADLRGANLFRASFFEAFGDDVRLDGAFLDGTYWEPK